MRDEPERNLLTKGLIKRTQKSGPKPKDYRVTRVFEGENDTTGCLFCIIFVTWWNMDRRECGRQETSQKITAMIQVTSARGQRAYVIAVCVKGTPGNWAT